MIPVKGRRVGIMSLKMGSMAGLSFADDRSNFLS